MNYCHCRNLVFPSLESLLELDPKGVAPVLQFPFYDRIFRYSMKKSKWPELVAKAQDENLKLATPMVKAWICYEVENNYWTWMYNWYCEVLPSKKGRDGKLPKACDLLKTNYDISSSNAEEEEDDLNLSSSSSSFLLQIFSFGKHYDHHRSVSSSSFCSE